MGKKQKYLYGRFRFKNHFSTASDWRILATGLVFFNTWLASYSLLTTAHMIIWLKFINEP